MGRTKSGCWTCRLQTKKKCDEAKPTCQRCANLRVHCFGYGQRPSPEAFQVDRRAVIASVGAASRSQDSKFRVWRMKPAPKSATQSEFVTQSNKLQQPCREDFASNIYVNNLIALDRVNSGMLDFCHPRLLRNYTRCVFWLNNRFYQCPGPYEGNAWMEGFLGRSKETRLAAALMGLTWCIFQDDTSRINNIKYTQALMVLHSIVVQSVRDEIEKSKYLMSSGEALAMGVNLAKCASLLLIFEAWRTLEGDCIPHVRGMNDIVRWIISRAPAAIDAATKVKVGTSELGKRAGDASITDTVMNHLALKWFVQAYTWNDITCSVWIGPRYTPSRSNDYYFPLLENDYLQMDKFMGCEDSILFAICQIVTLEEKWRNHMHHADRETLVRKAADIEQKLNIRLRSLPMERGRNSPGTARDAILVTEMWAHAALVYLHIVANGAYSDHPKLRQYISRSLDAFVNLPRRLDIHIALPFGILASMTDGEDAQKFLRIAESPKRAEEINPGQRKALGIIKECWRMKGQAKASRPDTGVSWRDGARSLGLVVLLV